MSLPAYEFVSGAEARRELRSRHEHRFREQQQKGYDGSRVSPGAFAALPERLVKRIGLTTHMGARLECAILSRLVYEHTERAEGKRVIEFAGEDRQYVKQEGEFVLSMERIAKDLWARWYRSAPEESEDFTRFYKRIQKSTGRLIEGGYVRKKGHPLGKKVFGCVWTFDETPLEYVYGEPLPDPGAPLTHAVEPIEVGPGAVNAVDAIGNVFVSDNPYHFQQGEVVSGLSRRGRGSYGNIYQWIHAVAQHAAGKPRYTTVGAWRDGEEGQSDKECFLPWITLDIDRVDPFEAFDAAQQVLDTLELRGAHMDEILVSFTGGKGYHVRIPAGAFGAPIFRSAAQVQRTLRALAGRIFDEVDLDEAVFNPLQNIRLVGSRRENGFYCTSWTAAEFRGMSVPRIYTASRRFQPFQYTNPIEAGVVPELAEALVSAAAIANTVQQPDFGVTPELGEGTSGVYQRAYQGCEESEVWWDDKDRFHVGRSKLLYVAACGLLRKHDYDRRAAYRALQGVNERCSPPVTARELEGRFDSAQRTLERAGEVRWR